MLARFTPSPRLEAIFSLGLIGVTTLLVHGVLIGQLGFYQEDWYVIWSGLTQGAKSLIPLYTFDRPLEGYLYALVYPILGNQPLPWHVYALLLRLVGAISLFWLLRMLWPAQKLETTAATLLFIVYPGFIQQPQATSFSVHLMAITLAILSITLSVYAVQLKRVAGVVMVTLAAMLLAVVYPLLMEYFIGLEGLRMVVLWIALQHRQPLPLQRALKPALVRMVKAWAPYWLTAGVFLYWRLWIFDSTRPTTNVDRLIFRYASDYTAMGIRALVEYVKDLIETIVLAWTVPLNNFFYYGSYRENLVAALVGLAALALLLLYFYLYRSEMHTGDDAASRNAWKTLILAGLLGAAFALLTVIAANREVRFEGREDRFSLPASIGVAMLAVGVVFYALRPRWRPWVLALLVGFSAFTQVNHAFRMRDYWDIQRQVWWQLTWRAPQLERATLLFVSLPPGFDFAEGYEAWAPASLIYSPAGSSPYIAGEVLNDETAYQIQQGGRDPKRHRGIWINRNFSKSLVLSLPAPQACLNVIDGAKYELSTQEDPLVRLVAPYSRIAQIETGAASATPQAEIFGAEPEHGWCYYYQKAMLARQSGDWAKIRKLGEQAEANGYQPEIATEWMPFLEAYASTGQDAKAAGLADLIRKESGPLQAICRQLESGVASYPGEYNQEKVIEILCSAQ